MEAAENAGGVAAELRIFLDAQLEAGDALVDVAPGFGFVALSAATAPAGAPSVYVLEQPDASTKLLQSSAREAGGWVDTFELEALCDGTLTDELVARVPNDGRIFVHADLAMLPVVLKGLAPLVLLGRVVACCLSIPPDADDTELRAAYELFTALGFQSHEMRDRNGEPQLFAVESLASESCIIAIAIAEPLACAETPSVQVHDRTADPEGYSAHPAASPLRSHPDADTAAVRCAATPVATSIPHQVAVHAAAPPAFAFIAPYCRTGYGIVGAHLLREFLLQDAPVAYFPLGQIDTTVVKNDVVRRALARQGSFDDSAPSVRLSQQFDLALHVGRGPRVGFPIFELDCFHPYERHHLERQDRLLVTCEWARGVLRENGLSKTPIDIVPLGVDRQVFHEGVLCAAPSATDTVFMNIGKLERRKGQLDLLRSFEAAFAPTDGVQLVLVCHNPFVDEKTFAELVLPFRTSPMASRITLVTTPLPTQRELATVMASADCAVFPARAEGWNLEALEMLSMGKPLIATDCTGHSAYLTHDNARLITVDALEQSVSGALKGRWAAWGARQHEQLVTHLRDVHAAKHHGSLGINHAGISTAQRLSWSASANALMQSVASA